VLAIAGGSGARYFHYNTALGASSGEWYGSLEEMLYMQGFGGMTLKNLARYSKAGRNSRPPKFLAWEGFSSCAGRSHKTKKDWQPHQSFLAHIKLSTLRCSHELFIFLFISGSLCAAR